MQWTNYSYEIILEILNLDCYIRMENFQAVYGREYRDYTSSDQKSANLTINKLSQATLNTQMYPNNINCSRIDTFSNYTSATYRQRFLSQNILPARTFTSRITTCSSFGNIYTTTSWVPWQSSLLASTDTGRQQSYQRASTTVVYESFQQSSKTLLLWRTLLLLRTLLLWWTLLHVFVS